MKGIKGIPASHSNVKIVIFMLLLVCLLIPQNSNALPSTCVIDLYQNAIDSAVKLSPPELKDILSPHLKAMKRQAISVLQTPTSQRNSQATYYNSIIDIAKEKDSKRYEYMSKAMSAITTDIFDKFFPMKDYEECYSSSILKKASIIVNKYDFQPDVLKHKKLNFNPVNYYKDLNTEEKLLRFYNIFVNTILNTWINIWDYAGRDISEIPTKYTVFKGEVRTPLRLLLSNNELRELEYDCLNSKLAEALKAQILHEDAEQAAEQADREKAIREEVDLNYGRRAGARDKQRTYGGKCEYECRVSPYSYNSTCFQGCMNVH